MATIVKFTPKQKREAERARIIDFAKAEVEDAVIFGKNAKIKSAPDCYWVQVWIRVPLSAAEEKKSGS